MRGKLLLLTGALMILSGAAPLDPSQPLSITVEGLRSMKGNLLICVSRTAAYFPDCSKDPQKRHLVVPATAAAIPLGGMAPGNYAVAIIHDENGNGKLDTFAGIPREGVGFPATRRSALGRPASNRRNSLWPDQRLVRP